MHHISWQAHQNSNSEMPENTLAALQYAWELGGIPELDIRQTLDGVIIGMHDATPRRTADTPVEDQDQEVSTLTYDRTQLWDVGKKFGDKFRGERVPSLEQVFSILRLHPEREIYLDYKHVDLHDLASIIQRYGVAKQVIFAHRDHNNCRIMKQLVPDLRTMLWITGKDTSHTKKCVANAAETEFDHLDIIQIHLVEEEQPGEEWRYRIDLDYLVSVLHQLTDSGRELEVLLLPIHHNSLYKLLHKGIRRYAVDEPQVFTQSVKEFFRNN